jgi:hypothetical protein
MSFYSLEKQLIVDLRSLAVEIAYSRIDVLCAECALSCFCTSLGGFKIDNPDRGVSMAV